MKSLFVKAKIITQPLTKTKNTKCFISVLKKD